MTNFSKAIKLAMEGGWIQPEPCNLEGIKVHHKGDALLGPLFWQCLGKKLGWNNNELFRIGLENREGWQLHNVPENVYHALRYFELVLTNGDTEKYWEELIK